LCCIVPAENSIERGILDPTGKGTTFYSWLEVSPSASMADIGRAYRKKSMFLQCVSPFPLFTLHALKSSNCSPDKNPGVKGIQERFARLGVVASILRSQEGRERFVSGDSGEVTRTANADADGLPMKIRLLL
jgi:hypothetical protein